MIDDSDVDFTILSTSGDAGPGAIGVVIAVLGLVLVVGVLYAASVNKDECAKQHCEHGAPILANHECLCAERATP